MKRVPQSAHEHPWKISDAVLFPLLALGLLLEWVWPTVIPLLPSFLRLAVGLVLFVGGGLMILWGKRTLDAAGQPNLPGTATTELLQDGAFAVSRNPNYLGAILAVLGGGFLFGSLWVFAAAVISAAILDRWMIAPEERYLSTQFGDVYAQYCDRVRRWF
jgi:protein-S-isoprenylcysteine O-methyltransferase Ste14